MSAKVDLPLPQMRALGETTRRDTWWVQPLLVFLGFMTFIVYSTWAAFQGQHYWLDANGANYLSPFYSPEIFGVSPHAWFGPLPDWFPWPSFLAFSPAFLILWAPGGFRFTCYYYRGAYYKAFWADPPNCAVGEPGFRKGNYRGEKKFPLVLQNIHRYFLYIALLFIIMLSYDAVLAYRFQDESGEWGFGIGVGTLILTVNPILLAGYTLGCHSLRHLIGGGKDCISSCSSSRQAAYKGVTCLNRRHMLWAWLSLFWVGFTDLYVRLCSMGIWIDWRIV